MDSIRLRQIREALDTDKRMYAAAFELEKRRVAKMDEKPDDQTAANQGSLETVGDALAELKENLEERVIALHSFSTDYKTSDDSVNTLAAVEATHTLLQQDRRSRPPPRNAQPGKAADHDGGRGAGVPLGRADHGADQDAEPHCRCLPGAAEAALHQGCQGAQRLRPAPARGFAPGTSHPSPRRT
jgi:hypothetical protein